jgi:hypothetical protein
MDAKPAPTKPATSWRDVLPIHPAAADFPRMTPDEFKALSEDIKKNGQCVPIAIIERARRRLDGTLHVSDPPLQEVLDGISRLDAMQAAGIAVIGKDGQLHKQVLRAVVDTDEVDPIAYVISANIHRRHLNVEQRRHSLIALIARTPEKSDRQIGREIGVDHKTVASARAKGEDVGRIPHVAERKDTKGRKQPSSKPPRKAKPTKVVAPPPPPPPSTEALQPAAESPVRPVPLPSPPSPLPRDDIGPDSANEAARLRVYVEKLEAEKRLLKLKVAGLEREVEELRGKLAARAGDMSIGEFQVAIKKWEETVEVQRGIIARLENENAKLRAGGAAPPLDDGLDIPECLRRAAP